MHRQLWFWLLLAGALFGVVLASRAPSEPAPGDSSDPVVNPPEVDTNATVEAEPSARSSEAASGEAAPLPRWVWGRVVDADGNAVADADVSLWVDAGPFRDSRVAAVAQTDRSGRYILRGRAEPDDRYAAVSVRKPGYQVAQPERVALRHAGWFDTHCGLPDEHEVRSPVRDDRIGVPVIRDARRTGARPKIVLRPGRRVEGRLRFSEKHGESFAIDASLLAGARVRGRSDRVGWAVEPDGRFVAWLDPKDTELGAVLRDGRCGFVRLDAGDAGTEPSSDFGERAEKAASRPRLLDDPSAAVSRLQIEVETETRLRRIVGASGPLPGARVWAAPRYASWLVTEHVTDATGELHLPWRSHVIVTHPEHRSARVRASKAAEEIRLEPARWLQMRLVPRVAPPAISCEPLAVRFDRSGDGYRSRPFDPECVGAELGVRGFMPEPVEWPDGEGLHDLGRVELERGGWIDLQIVDSKGNPIPHAEVTDWWTRTSDAQGRLQWGPLPAEVAEFTVSADGFRSSREAVSVGRQSTTHRVVLFADATVSISVVDVAGVPIRALVTAEGSRAHHWTDSDGAVDEMAVPSGSEVTLSVTTDSHLVHVKVPPLLPGEHRTLDPVVLPTMTRVEVLVRDAGGRPVVEAPVQLTLGRFGRATVETNLSGVAVFPRVGSGQRWLTVDPRDSALPPRLERLEVPLGRSVFEVEVNLPPARELRVQVVDSNGSPIDEAEVEFTYSTEELSRSGSTDERGEAQIEGLCEGEWWVRVSDGLLEQSIRIGTLAEVPSRFVLGGVPGLRVKIENEDEDFSYEDLTILCDGHRVGDEEINEEGIVRFALAAGEADFQFETSDHWSPVYRVAIPPEGEDVELAISLLPSEPETVQASFELRVTDRRGVPERGALVRTDGRRSGFTSLLGRRTVEFEEPPETLEVWRGEVQLARVVDPVAHARDGILAIVVPELAIVRVRLEEEGAPLSFDDTLEVIARRVGEFAGSEGEISLSGGGRFAQAELQAGDWELVVRWLGVEVASDIVSVQAGRVSEHAISLPRRIEVYGSLRGDDPISSVAWTARDEVLPESIIMEVLPDGTYRGHVRTPGTFVVHANFRYRTTVRVQGSGRYDLDFTGQSRGRVIGSTSPRTVVYLGRGSRGEMVRPDPDGRFSVALLEPGLHRFMVRQWNRRIAGFVQVDDPRSEIDIDVSDLIALEVSATNSRVGQRFEIADWNEGLWVPRGEEEADLRAKPLVSLGADQWWVVERTYGGFASIVPEPGVSKIRVTLEPAGFLEVSLALRGAYSRWLTIEPLSGGLPGAARSRDFRWVLPEGRYRLRAGDPVTWEATVDIRAGEVTTVETATFVR